MGLAILAIHLLSSIVDEHRPQRRPDLRPLVPGPGRPQPDRHPQPARRRPPAHDRRRDRRGGRHRPVHRLAPPEAAGAGGLRPRRPTGDQPLLPGQPALPGGLPDRRRARHGVAPRRAHRDRSLDRAGHRPGQGASMSMSTSTNPLRIREMVEADWPAVAAIYAAGIATGNATFETQVPSWERWSAGHLERPRLVAVDEHDRVVGWTALSPVSDRCAYAGVADDSVYVDPAATSRGVGSALLARLLAEAEAVGLWTVQTGAFPENEASLALHRRAGFRVVGVRERIGKLNGRWRDVVFLERRSQTVDC